jgi:uncharacterized membrane protein
MQEFFLRFTEAGLPKPAAVFLISMLPIAELRGAIPWALLPQGGGALDPWTAYGLAVAGNLVPVVPLLLWLEPISRFARRHPLGDRFFEWLFARTRRRSELVQKYEALGLALFVAVPLPVTGAWTGTVAAFLFGIPFRLAFPAIAGGVLLAGLVVSLACQGVVSLWGLAH